MTRQEIRNRILSGLNESTSSPVHWSTAQVDASINEALEVLAEDGDICIRSFFIPLREGMTYYTTSSLSPDLILPTRLWTPTNNRRLTATTLSDLDEFSDTWESTTGDPEAWFPVSWDMFGIYPHPASAGGILRIDGTSWPRELLDDDDEPELPSSSIDAIIGYGIYDGLLKQFKVEEAMNIFQQVFPKYGAAKHRSGVGRIMEYGKQIPQAGSVEFPIGIRRS